MQDNSKDIFANKGWEAMELTLDKEMPQKKKRRFFIWWFFGGILLVAALLIYKFDLVGIKPNIVSIQKQNEDVVIDKFSKIIESTTPETAEEYIAPSESKLEIIEQSGSQTKEEVRNPIKQNADFVIPAQEEVTNPVQEIEGARESKNEIQEIRIKTKSSKVDPLYPISVTNQEPITENIAAPTTDKPNVPIVGNPVTKIETEELNNTNSVKDVAVSETLSKSENLVDHNFRDAIEQPLKERLLLNIAMLSPYTDLGEINFERDLTIINVEEKKLSYWYASAGGSLGWGPIEDLMDVGAHIDFGFSFHDKIDLGLTFGLGAFRYAASTTEKTLISGAGRNVFSLDEAQNILNSSFDNTSYLDFGTHLNWHATEKFSIRAGAGYSYLFTSMFNRNNGAENDVLGAPIGGPLDMMDVEVAVEPGENFTFEYNLSQKWFPYTSIGLQYGINDKLALNFAYRKVYGELFEQSSNPLSMDRLRLGIHYRFLKKASKR